MSNEIASAPASVALPEEGADFASLFRQSIDTLDCTPGKLVTAVVMELDDQYVTVYAGLKSEGLIPRRQFGEEERERALEVGDPVQVILETIDDGLGCTQLSREKARRQEVWVRLESCHKEGGTVRGLISGKVKGGYTIDVEGMVRGFLPGSLVERRPVQDISNLEGQTLEFRIIRLEADRNNVVLSRRAVLEEENSGERDGILATLAEGQVLKGTVKNMTDYGAFIGLGGGVDGLLHVTDMSWKRVNRPEEVVQTGQELEVKVLRFDAETQRISLGLKQLAEDPWNSIERKYPPGTRVSVRVTKIMEYGCFAELEPGVEGLVHASELDWTSQHVQPSRYVHVGQEAEVEVLEVNVERHRISLSTKRCRGNPWKDFSEQHKKGDRLDGIVRSITDFGLFVELTGGISGLVHVSDLVPEGVTMAAGEQQQLLQRHSRGEKLAVMVLAIDTDRERISLGVKQLSDELSSYMEQHPLESVVDCVVEKVSARAATLQLHWDGPGQVRGVLRAAAVGEQLAADGLRELLSSGDRLQLRVIDVDHRQRQVVLSPRDCDEAQRLLSAPRPTRRGAIGQLLDAEAGTVSAESGDASASEPPPPESAT